MDRQRFINWRRFIILSGGLFATPLIADAQRPPKIARTGFLHPASPEGVLPCV